MLRKETFPGKSFSTQGTGQLSGGQVGHVVLVQAPELNFSRNIIRVVNFSRNIIRVVNFSQNIIKGTKCEDISKFEENLPTPVSWKCFATDVAHEHCT